MSGIAHLTKDNTTRAARIDSMDTDSVNSIIERISGVNPTKLASGGKTSSPPSEAAYGAPPSPITENFQPQQQHQMYGAPQGGQQMQEMQQRMAQLEQKVAYYEGDDVQTAASKKIKTGQDAQTNRGADSGAFAPNMRSKRAQKLVVKQDPADGEKDPPKAPPGGQAMPQEQTNILGISMNEWNDLIGVTTPYANPAERAQAQPSQNLSESHGGQQSYHEADLNEGYFTEDELAEAWFGFLADKGYEPAEFSDFVEAADEYGDEVALLAIQDLEDEFQEAVDAYMEHDAARGGVTSLAAVGADTGGASAGVVEATQEEIDEIWEMWLETRGLSVQMFNHLVDEAIASDDQDEMDTLLAVEELFQGFLQNEVNLPPMHPMSGDGAGKRRSVAAPSQKSTVPRDVKAAPMKGDSKTKDPRKMKMHPRAQMDSVRRMLSRRLAEATPVAKDDPIHQQVGSMKSLVTKKPMAAKSKARGVKPVTSKSGHDPRKWAGEMGLADDISFDEDDGFGFACESGDDGEPKIPMARIMKALKKRKGRK